MAEVIFFASVVTMLVMLCEQGRRVMGYCHPRNIRLGPGYKSSASGRDIQRALTWQARLNRCYSDS